MTTAVSNPGMSDPSVSSDVNRPICRICLESDSVSHLLSPCDCKGTAQYVHRHCLKRWLKSRRSHRRLKCEICGTFYIFRYKNRWQKTWLIVKDKWQTFEHSFVHRNLHYLIMISSLILCLLTVQLYYVLLSGPLDVTIHSAQLPDMDVLIWRKSDAYSIVCVDGECECETDIHNDDNSPNWNHRCLNWQNASVSFFSKVTFLVYDADHGHDDDFIGGVSLAVYQMLFYGYNGKDVVLKWDKPYAGSLIIRMRWWPTLFNYVPQCLHIF